MTVRKAGISIFLNDGHLLHHVRVPPRCPPKSEESSAGARKRNGASTNSRVVAL